MTRPLISAVLIAVALALPGCGVRGPLEPPPGAVAAPPPAPGTAPGRPTKPFILDGIL